MRKVLVIIGICSGAYCVAWIVVFIFLHKCGYDVKYWVTTSIQLFGGLATFAAVIVSLFGNAIKRKFDRPNIQLKCLCDDAHCALKGIQDATASSHNRKTLEIYMSAVNSSAVEARDVQLVCIKAFVSEDGEHFSIFQTFRAASFRWLYSSEQNRFLTTLRHSIETFIKVVDLVEEDVDHDNVKVGEEMEAVSSPMREMHFEICLELNVDGNRFVKVDEKFKAILLSLRLASSNTPPTYCYMKIHNKSLSLDVAPSNDRLEISFLTKDQAMGAISVNLD